MDIAGFLHSLTPLDFLLGLMLAGAFVLGYYQGAGRAVISALAWFFSFILAANLRAPLGGLLATQWTSFSSDYDLMLAFLISFVVSLGVCGVLIVGATQRQALLPASAVLDPLLGGTIALVVAVLVLAGVVAGLDSGYQIGPGFGFNEVPALGSLQTLLSQSVIGSFVAATVVPMVTTVTGPFLPMELIRLFGG
ncbi:MAG: CvpA family protein [Candidatus Limnocylindrales bacterium]